jgi:MAP3K TRAFs-binding domain
LALATYKSEQPSPLKALKSAHDILQEMSPKTSNNPETLGLWGAVHKRLWEKTGKLEYLDESITAYERGFYMKQDHYNGINLSYLLNVRAVEKIKSGIKDEAITDSIIAKRVRQEVIRYTAPLIESMEAKEKLILLDETRKKDMVNKRYWVVATLWEAAIGAGDEIAVSKWEQIAKAMHVADWMQETRESQGKKLKVLLETYADLYNVT